MFLTISIKLISKQLIRTYYLCYCLQFYFQMVFYFSQFHYAMLWWICILTQNPEPKLHMTDQGSQKCYSVVVETQACYIKNIWKPEQKQAHYFYKPTDLFFHLPEAEAMSLMHRNKCIPVPPFLSSLVHYLSYSFRRQRLGTRLVQVAWFPGYSYA